MPVGFGFSVGDFIAVLNLIHDAIEAINSNRGASATYGALLRELYVLESALLSVKSLELEDSLEAEKRAIEQVASQCHLAIDIFLGKIQAYQPHLRAGGSGDGSRARMKDTWAKVKWALCKKEDLDNFKVDLRGHSTSIQLLLQIIEMCVEILVVLLYHTANKQKEECSDPSAEGRTAPRDNHWKSSEHVDCFDFQYNIHSQWSSEVLPKTCPLSHNTTLTDLVFGSSCIRQGKAQLEITTKIM
jgi:hypothetical protein